MRGFRKVLIALVIIAVAAMVPLNDAQANVLIAVAQAMLYSNAAVHVARAIGGNDIAEKVRKRIGGHGSPAPTGAGTPEKPWKAD